MDTQNKIAEVQLMILDRIIDREERVSEIYSCCAARFPDHFDFWEGLAREEKGHANILRRFEPPVRDGAILWKLGRLAEEALTSEETMLEQLKQELQDGSIDMTKTLKIVFHIENSLLDSKFYDTVNCEWPEFVKTADVLRRAEEIHSQRLKEFALKYASNS